MRRVPPQTAYALVNRTTYERRGQVRARQMSNDATTDVQTANMNST